MRKNSNGASKISKGAGKIYIVEDDQFSINFYTNRLVDEGYEILSSPEADTAFRQIKKDQPDLIIVDLMIQGGNGFDLIGKIRKEKGFKKTPIIVLSNLGQDKDVQEAIKKGANKYFVKANTQFAEIEKAIKELIK